MKLLFTMRTADRSPKPNYLMATVRSLVAGGVAGEDIHIFQTSPTFDWRTSYAFAHFHVPTTRLTPNQNGIAPIALLDEIEADWIILSEDDLEWCADPIGSMSRWLECHATPDVLMYRFFAFDRLTPVNRSAASAPLREQKGSQAVALRADDARRCAAWAAAHPLDWRPRGAPFQHRPHDGFDKLLGYWALQDRPSVTYGLVSQPFFVKHLGVQSSLHSRGVRMDRQFIGDSAWP